jgi:hypothetical protein
MTEDKKLFIAKRAIDKKMDYEELKYSDYMYGNEDLTDDVYAYVEEYDSIGKVAFYEKYPDNPVRG